MKPRIQMPKLFETPGHVFRMKQRFWETLSEPWRIADWCRVNMIPVFLYLRSTSPSLKVLRYKNYTRTYHLRFCTLHVAVLSCFLLWPVITTSLQSAYNHPPSRSCWTQSFPSRLSIEIPRIVWSTAFSPTYWHWRLCLGWYYWEHVPYTELKTLQGFD